MTATASRSSVERRHPGYADTTRPGFLLQRIRAEFVEMPGLALTPQQAARLWSLTAPGAEALLTELVSSGFLMRDPRGLYRRGGCPRCA